MQTDHDHEDTFISELHDVLPDCVSVQPKRCTLTYTYADRPMQFEWDEGVAVPNKLRFPVALQFEYDPTKTHSIILSNFRFDFTLSVVEPGIVQIQLV